MTAAAVAVTVGVAAEPATAAAEPATAAAAPPVAAKPAAAKVVSRPDLVSAQVTARAQGARVEVEALRDETSTTWVNPDGTLTTEQHQGPIRFKDAKGGWRDVDLEMAELTDGTVGPRGHVLGLSLGGAGTAAGGAAPGAAETDLAVVGERPGKDKTARQVTVGFGGRLGKPVLDGSTATYRDVAPGVDLVVEARRTGYETHLVITSADALAGMRAAAKGGPISWQIPVRTKGLTARSEKDGSVSFVGKDGTVASYLAPPIAWDATVDERSGNRVNESPVTMTVTQQGKGRAVLTLAPDQDWLFSPQRTFPVTVDPTYASATVTTTADAYVSSAFPTANYLYSTELRVGTYNGGGDKYRSLLRFPLADIRGKQVVSASLSLYEFHSWSCTPSSFYVWSTSAVPDWTTLDWNSMPAAGAQYGATSVAKGYSSSCAAGRVSVPVTGLVDAYSKAATTTTLGYVRLHASETDNSGWKKFYSLESAQDPYLTFTYNRKPNLASKPSVTSSQSNTYTAPGTSTPMLFTSAAKPTLTTVITDPDASKVYSNIEVHSDTSGTKLVTECTTGQVASGAVTSCAVPAALADNKTYYLRAAAADDRGLWNGTWSAWQTLYTSFGVPPAPVISCPSPYSAGSWQDTAPGSDITCTITAAGVAGTYGAPGYLDLTVDGVAKQRATITASNDPNVAKTTVVVTKANGAHSITATAISRSLTPSAKTTSSFGWGGASLTAPKPKAATSGKIGVAAGGPPRNTATAVTAQLQWRVASSGKEADGWTAGPALQVKNAASATTPVSVDPYVWDTQSAVQEAGASQKLPSRTPVLLDVQVCFTYTGVNTSQCTWSQSPISVTRVPHAFGNGYPTADAGPGQVALFTGELNTSATDVTVPGYAGDLAVSRSHTSFDGDGSVSGWPKDPVTGVFGPGWTASLEGPDAGAAGLQVIDNTRQDGTIVLVDEEGNPLVYQNPAAQRAYATGPAYLAATDDTVDAAAVLKITGTGAAMSMTLTEEDGTVTTWQPVSYTAGTDTSWKPVSVNEPGGIQTSYGHDDAGRVTRIVSTPRTADGTGTAASCPTQPGTTLPRGCRALDIVYADASTPSPATTGDIKDQVKEITATLWDSTSAAMTTTTVATYRYYLDSGRLSQLTDTRTGLTTEYTWDGSSTRLSSIKAAGLAAHRFTYDLTDPTLPKVAALTRDAPVTGGSAVTLARYVYDVPLSGSGLPDVSAAAVAAWYQNTAPAFGYAVFGQDYTGPVTGTGVDWTYADLQYADAQGYTVNTASFGAGAWQRTATDYDVKGNPVRELDAAALNQVAAGTLTEPQVDALSTQTVYNDDSTLVTDTYGPARPATLPEGTKRSDGTTTAAGSTVRVRPHTHTDYDEGAPNTGVNPATGQPYRLATTITTGAAEAAAALGAADLEVISVTKNDYAKLDPADASEGDGWTLGTPTRVTTGGITNTTRYDAMGRTTQVRQPLSDGTDAGTTRTRYYTAEPNTTDPDCGDKLEWAGLLCRTFPAAGPSAGAAGAATLPDQLTAAYNRWLLPTRTVETSGTGAGAATRTTTTDYDPAGRVIRTQTTSTIPGSTQRPAVYTHYDPATGMVDYTGATDPSTIALTDSTKTTVIDGWGRPVTTRTENSAGGYDTTITSYDTAGRVATVQDLNGTTTYGYDGTDADTKPERRGLVTTQTVTRPGAGGDLRFTGAYDAAGQLVAQKLPGGIIQRTRYDEAGEPESLTYSGQVTPVTESKDADGNTVYTPGTPQQDQVWLAWTVRNDVAGRVRQEFTGPGAAFDGTPGVTNPADIAAPAVGQGKAYDRDYSYDQAGRLTTVVDQTAAAYASTEASPCTVRDYTLDNNGRRTNLATTQHSDGDCTATATGTTTTTHAYDTADRPTTGANGTGQYGYDTFGRQTTIPAADTPAHADNPTAGDITLGYFDDDLPRSVTQDGTTTTFSLDSAGRRQDAVTTHPDGSTSTLVRHYTDASDNPAWVTKDGAVTRYNESIGGDLGVSITQDGSASLTIANLHGDAVTTIDVAADQATDTPRVGITGWADYTEYGSVRATAPDGSEITTPAVSPGVAGILGYGWLGTKQRSTSAEIAGLTLMGMRLYNAVTGRFTSPDPEPGGNENAFNYPNDPINLLDLDGRRLDHRDAGGGGSGAGPRILEGSRLNSGKRYPSRAQAEAEARRDKRAGTRGNTVCYYRGTCKSGNHVHVDVYKKKPGMKAPKKAPKKPPKGMVKIHTHHYRW